MARKVSLRVVEAKLPTATGDTRWLCLVRWIVCHKIIISIRIGVLLHDKGACMFHTLR